MRLSFAWTADDFLNGTKSATRRFFEQKRIDQWQNAWDKDPQKLHSAWDKLHFAGGKEIGMFRLTCRPFLQALGDMTIDDLCKEGPIVHQECKGDPKNFPAFVNQDPSVVALVIEFVLVKGVEK